MKRRPAGRSLFTVALISDTHVNEKEDWSASPYPANAEANPRARHVFNYIRQSDAAFCVHMGDMVNPVPELPSYADAASNFHDIAGNLGRPLYLVPGNHDIGDKPVDWMPAGMVDAHNIGIYEKHFGPHFYSFDHGNAHFVVLNSSLMNSGDPAEAKQRNWVEEDLKQNADKRTFFFIHYPIFVSDPEEPGSYDNIDEPGRGWLLDLLTRYKPEALFCAHVHNFWYDVYTDTEIYVLPSTCFVRHDYSEMYRIDGGDQFGRNDVAKLGHVTLEIFETGHVAHYHRTYGSGLAKDQVAALPNYSATHVKTSALVKLGVDMRHAWAEEMNVSPSGAVDEFRRKRARNDYPVMALWEMGLRTMRVPVQDLLDAKTRRRMELMCDVGHLFHVYVYDVPDQATQDLLIRFSSLVDKLEIVLNWESRDRTLPLITALQSACGCRTLISRVNRKDAAKKSGGKYNHLISHGFSLDEADELLEFSRTAPAGNMDGFVFSIPREVDPASAVAALDRFSAASGKSAVLYVKSTSGSPWAAFMDDHANAQRIAVATLAAVSSRTTEVILDSFCDSDRGYFVRTGLIDRRFNPRLAGKMLSHLVPMLDSRKWQPSNSPNAITDEDDCLLAVVEAGSPEMAEVRARSGGRARWMDIETGQCIAADDLETSGTRDLLIITNREELQ